MWSKTYSTKITGVSAAEIWNVWADVDRWAEWQDDVDSAHLHGPFAKGSQFLLRPKGGPKVKIGILNCEPRRNFTDVTHFPLARMYGSHDMIEHDDGLELKTTISIEGPLSFLWRKIVAEGVANSLPSQTDALVARARLLKANSTPDNIVPLKAA